MTDAGGVWRTISGRRVFIKDGQSLTDAMRESGKFKETQRSKTKSGKYEYELGEGKPDVTWLNSSFVVYDEKGNVVFKEYFNKGSEEAIKSNFEFNEEWNIKQYSIKNKKELKLQRDATEGNYRRTKYGKEMYKHAKQIQEETGDVIKNIKIDKSNISDSRYINMEVDTDKYPSFNDEYTIRVSDHKRPPYSSTGIMYEHQYDYEVIVDSFDNVDWNYIKSSVIQEINDNK